ncbi:hypothetical protein CAEBREN_19246 [Caenorhabditis brenneri]|uniref:F-box associated domain-containing protein n=1 Tax=Caenorhabditis brenneri TaxID=135651 RepID=G0MLE9_CAEBE|nr:hypothetical protein CAEBREN_19246 [Caenorhabditis brenneri]
MDEVMQINNIVYFEEGDTIMKIQLGNADIECTWSDNQLKTANASSHIEVTVAIFRHVLNLFKFSETIQLDLLLDSNEVNNLPVLEGVTSTALRGGPFDITTVEGFCSKYPTQKSIALVSKLSGGLSPNSSIFGMEEIYFHEPENRISTFLDNFTGRIAMISNAQFPEASIIQFMRKWMTGEAHQNLEVLRVTFERGHLIKRWIVVEEFKNEAKVCDSSNKPENYEFNSQIIGLDKPHSFHFSRFMDIERHSDGKRASFLVFPSGFIFCVWKND